MTNINKNSVLEIERGIPLPSNIKSGWALTVSKMSEGDSVVVKNFTELNKMRSALSRAGWGSSAMELEDQTFRVWKVKKRFHKAQQKKQ
mgnify:CR=1 FL=1|jgi:hypothetical protein|tara:strand:- start:12 stop:278 length:267 start_codon:yes stop_codon:yes gene_type:complete